MLQQADHSSHHNERQTQPNAAATVVRLVGGRLAAFASWWSRLPYSALIAFMVAMALLVLAAGGMSRVDRSISAESLLSIDERPGAQIVKLDEQGRWKLFEGVSVVMPLRTERHSAFRHLFTRVKSNYTALLTANPLSSYHVTLCTVLLRRDMSQSRYNELVIANKPRLERLKARLAEETQSVTFNFSGVWWNPAGISVDLQPASEEDAAVLHRYESIAAESLGPLYQRMERYHMGFSYIVQARANDSEGALTELVNGLPSLFREVEFVATVPQLVAFSTMLRFYPV